MQKLNKGRSWLYITAVLWGLSGTLCVAEEPAEDTDEPVAATVDDGDEAYRREIQQECESQATSMELEGSDRADYVRLCLQQYGL
ncbi:MULTISPECIES: hypothetical protein [Thalassolituus]|jgi:hypothetical protein|uniref:hypothetical protein n=1 Tax=Thalassolituus TaxID=187492 RepID=UPI000C4FDB8E|nr:MULTISPECIES: hypothetical protein [Thalassolituus]MCA6061972.1 hypothetical protein [Thalassolituus sp. ST750PaO-4]MCB2385341.1 hypothetical protein [Thalassolituus alkanivorans]MCB2421802.1 hypothetical protein [Thalassolituus alkanivorans]PIQ40383.1 MAG: hypothetical protein COW58_06235 [Thalassolituus sp. CG17_big_fil_post_rev_8_21_14_2_50_53_8]